MATIRGDLWNYILEDNCVSSEPLSDQTGRDDTLDTYEFRPITPPEEEPEPEEPEPIDPTNPTRDSPQQVIRGAIVEHYEDYGSGLNRQILSILNFQETLEYYLTRVRPMAELFQSLPITQTLSAVLVESPNRITVNDTITVTPEATSEALRPQSSQLGVEQTISFNKESTRFLTDTLELTEYLSAYKVSNRWVNPGIGSPGSSSSLLLEWDIHSVELRNPQLGDTSSYEAVRVQRNSRGNDLIVFREPMWPDKEVLHFQFEYLSSTQAIELLDFMRISLGQKITLTDQYAREWEGYIITPEAEIIQTKRTGFSAEFDFQGVLV